MRGGASVCFKKFAPSLALMRRLQSEDEPDLEAGNYLDARTSNDADETDATATAIDWGDDDGNMGLEIDWGAGDVVADDADAGDDADHDANHERRWPMWLKVTLMIRRRISMTNMMKIRHVIMNMVMRMMMRRRTAT